MRQPTLSLSTEVVMKARKTGVPFILLAAMGLCASLAGVWVVFHGTSVSMIRLIYLVALLSVIFVLVVGIVRDFQKSQSVEISDEGIRSLVPVKNSILDVFPRLESVLLVWQDVVKAEVCANLIYVYGPGFRVVANTLLFDDPRNVINFVDDAIRNRIPRKGSN